MERLKIPSLPGLMQGLRTRKGKVVFGLVVGVGLFFSVRPWLAVAAPLSGEASSPDREVQVSQDVDGNSMVLLAENSSERSLPQIAGIPNTDPILGDRYVVWMGQTETGWHIFAYDLQSKADMQITYVEGANVHPVTSGEWIAWEHFDGTTWKAQYFDGTQVKELDLGAQPIRDLQISSHFLVFAQMLETGTGWQPVWCDLLTGGCNKVGVNDSASNVMLLNNELSWTNGSGGVSYFDIVNRRLVIKSPVAGQPLAHPPFVPPLPEDPQDEVVPEASESATATQSAEPSDPVFSQPDSEASGSSDVQKQLPPATPEAVNSPAPSSATSSGNTE